MLAPVSAIASAASAPIANAPGRYAPREECANLLGAAAFRANLARAVQRRDVAALVALAVPTVKLDFGGGAGQAELRRRLSGRDGAALWRELDGIVGLGCAVDHGNLAMPRFFAQSLGDFDAFEVYLVAGANVPVYPVADRKSRPTSFLSWQLVSPVAGFREGDAFQQIDVVGMRRRGYVATARLRSQVGYRLIAGRQRGVWKITAFVAGD